MAEQATPNGTSAPPLLGSGTDPNGTVHFADGNCMTNAFSFHAMHTKKWNSSHLKNGKKKWKNKRPQRKAGKNSLLKEESWAKTLEFSMKSFSISIWYSTW